MSRDVENDDGSNIPSAREANVGRSGVSEARQKIAAARPLPTDKPQRTTLPEGWKPPALREPDPEPEPEVDTEEEPPSDAES